MLHSHCLNIAFETENTGKLGKKIVIAFNNIRIYSCQGGISYK